MSASSLGVEVRRLLSAPPERVFSAFADKGLIARWLRPSPDVKLTVLSFDFRPGGEYRLAYDVPDGRRMIVVGIFRAWRGALDLLEAELGDSGRNKS